jgi:hypothetical protein
MKVILIFAVCMEKMLMRGISTKLVKRNKMWKLSEKLAAMLVEPVFPHSGDTHIAKCVTSRCNNHVMWAPDGLQIWRVAVNKQS